MTQVARTSYEVSSILYSCKVIQATEEIYIFVNIKVMYTSIHIFIYITFKWTYLATLQLISAHKMLCYVN